MANNEQPISGKTIAIFGATSEIGEQIALRLARGNRLVLAGRRLEPLKELAATLEARGAESTAVQFFDAADTESHRPLIEDIEAGAPHGRIDIAFAMFGVLGDQEKAETDGAEVQRVLHTDFTAQAVLLTELSRRMRRQKTGTLVAFSSIAGARVRRPNYVYGSAKAGLDGFVQGMQDALRGSGVRLMVIRPGFVIGRMTEGMKPAPLSSTPEVVAQATVSALNGTKDSLWVPKPLGVLALAMKLVPRWLWRLAPR